MPDRALEIISMKDPTQFGLPAELLVVGDKIIEVAGEKAVDQLDFHFHTSLSDTVALKVEHRDGQVEDIVVPSEAVAGLEIWFKAMDFRRCRCKCPFCFVDQMPKGLRKSLYVKDEDFRLSFFFGNFTTMNDITEAQLEKIIRQKNSPQWVSVHVIEEEMRKFIFGRPMKRNILDTLRTMAEGGISVHTQAVVVPGQNDGDYLRETIESLAALHENILTLAVVPVGLTKHRGGLPDIRSYRNEEMGEVLDLCEPYRRKFLDGPRGSHFVFPSDEWYVGAGRVVPSYDDYEGFPQLDNGGGVIRDLLDGMVEDLDALGTPARLDRFRIVTGELGAKVFERYVLPLFSSRGAESPPEIVNVENRFFGASVTCSGLLVGEDIVEAVRESEHGDDADMITLIPPNCLNHEQVTIDGMDVARLSEVLGHAVVVPDESVVGALHGPMGAMGA